MSVVLECSMVHELLLVNYIPACEKKSVNYLNAQAKVWIEKWIFVVQFPGNRFEYRIILNDIERSTIWDIQIQVSFPGFEIAKIPEFNLYINLNIYWRKLFLNDVNVTTLAIEYDND